jgi:hypothetical protein
MTEKIRKRITYKKEPFLILANEVEMDNHWWQSGFKFRITHSDKPSSCKILHDDLLPEHQMSTTYRQCVSNRCHDESSTLLCPYKIKQVKCCLDMKYYLYIPTICDHLDLYSSRLDILSGIHCFFENEILRIFKERACSGTNIYIILKNNQKNETMKYPSIPIPDPDQINNFIKRHKKKVQVEMKEEIAQVITFINMH